MGANLTIHDRATLSMTAVSEVLSFDADLVTVMTPRGQAEIEGRELKIVNMSSESGELTVVGQIDGVYYAAKPGAKKGLFRGK